MPEHSDNEEIHLLQLTFPASQIKLVGKERLRIKLEQALQALRTVDSRLLRV